MKLKDGPLSSISFIFKSIMQERLHSVLYAVLTRVCAASGERGFPSSHTK